jgi:ABC-type transport system involved in multi-copper enzyme maturation permease subunit
MINLLKTEWLKIKSYKAFWWLLAITALTYPGINYLFYKVYDSQKSSKNEAVQMAISLIKNPFAHPEVWHSVAYFSSWFIFIPAVLIIMFITNEYSYKTHKQNIIDGWSRNQFMTGKMLNLVIVTLIITLLYIAVSLVTGRVNAADGTGSFFDGAGYIGLFTLQTFAQLSIAFMIGFLVRKAFISLGIFIFYFLILEPIVVGIGRVKANDMFRFLPLEISDRMIPIPAFLGELNKEAYEKALAAINTHVILTILLTLLVWFICFRVNSKRDL